VSSEVTFRKYVGQHYSKAPYLVLLTDRPSSAEHDSLSAEEETPEQLEARLHYLSGDMRGPKCRRRFGSNRDPGASTSSRVRNWTYRAASSSSTHIQDSNRPSTASCFMPARLHSTFEHQLLSEIITHQNHSESSITAGIPQRSVGPQICGPIRAVRNHRNQKRAARTRSPHKL
jgi:hypothetical protein